MKYASIDIGTNTLRLLVSELTSAGCLKPLVHRRFITRLGGGFTIEKGIEGRAGERAFEALDEIRKVLETEAPDIVAAVATSAVRRAVNKDWFLAEGSKRLGHDIRIIDGETEARLALKGVTSVLKVTGLGKKRLVMDIGGGSTEFTLAIADDIKGAFSMELGVVHLTEKFLFSDPPTEDELDVLKEAIGERLTELKKRIREASIDPLEFSPVNRAVFVGTAGTVTTLSAMKLGLKDYEAKLINGTHLTIEEVEGQFARLKALTMAERLEIDALEEGREDLIIAGTLIVLMTMNAFGFKRMTVSDAGLLEGIILDGLKGRENIEICK
ncbi:MAG: Ppx/GppA phosphatase family protein [Thermodesulfobacteriota bacterium]